MTYGCHFRDFRALIFDPFFNKYALAAVSFVVHIDINQAVIEPRQLVVFGNSVRNFVIPCDPFIEAPLP